MPGKRQHFVPLFMLRRFCELPERRSIWRLDVSSGTPRRANPVNEAVRNRYYRILHEDGTVDDTADELLDYFESEAAKVISRLEQPGFVPSDIDRSRLVLFILTLKQRTPEGRQHTHEADVRMAEMDAEVRLSDPDLARRIADRDARDPAEVEADRLRLLEDLRAGRLVFESTPSREVGLMFTALDRNHDALMAELDWTLLRAPAGKRFILSDNPVCHYDPTPKMPGAGAGFLSSPGSQTLIPLDPGMALMLTPRHADLPAWREVVVSERDLKHLNLIIYAQAHGTVYGQTQADVAGVRADAKSERRLVGQFRRRPPRIWVSEIGPEDHPGEGGIRTFTSTAGGVKLTRQLRVSAEGEREARDRAWPPIDDEGNGHAA